MGGKTLIGGTAYKVKGGKTLVGGTAYKIKKGKTLIGGTAKTISFDPTFADIMADATVAVSGGRNSGSTSTVRASISSMSGTWYAFTFGNGYMSIAKIVKSSTSSNPTITYLAGNYVSGSGGMLQGSARYLSYSLNGSSGATVYGATIILFTFPNFTETQVETVFSHLTMTRLNGKNVGTAATCTGTVSSSTHIIVAYATNMGISDPIGTVTYGDYTGNPSLLYVSGTTAGFSTNGTSNTSVNGCSLITFTES